MTVRLPARVIAAVGALALTGAALAVLAPAGAASVTLTYTCTVAGAAKQFTVVADTDAPATIAYGETITPTASGTITVPEDVVTTARDGGAKKLDGKADVAATVSGAARPMTLTAKQTNVPNSGPMQIEVSGPAGSFVGAAAGTTYAVAVGDFTATLNLYEANGTALPAPLSPQVVPCLLNSGQNPAVDTITVVKDATTTAVAARDIAAHHRPKAKVTVTAEHGSVPQGSIRAKLVRKGKVLQTKVLGLRDGARAVRFAPVAKTGDYTVKVRYRGGANWTGDRETVTFTVK